MPSHSSENRCKLIDYMAFAINAMIYLITALIIVKLRRRTRLNLDIIIGVISVAISCFILFACTFIFKSVSIKDYRVVTVKNYSCRLAESDNSVSIELSDKKYYINYDLWKDGYDSESLVSSLNKTSMATVWLGAKSNYAIKGISTIHVQIDPTIGIKRDNENRRYFLWLSVLFGSLGFLVIVLAAFSGRKMEVNANAE